MRQNGETVSPMSNEGRNSYVTEHITHAMLALLVEKPLEDISISALCDRAGVGRASFYRNFDSKEAVLRDHLHGLLGAYLAENGGGDGQPLSSQLGGLFAHFEAHSSFYKLLNARNMLNLLEDELIAFWGLTPECTVPEAYAKAYVAYAIYGWVRVWFQRGMRETAREIAALFQSQGL